MTPEQQRALAWIVARGGTGIYRGAGLLMCAGEQAPFGRAILKALMEAGAVSIEKNDAGDIIVTCL